jgi:hypothetical protein
MPRFVILEHRWNGVHWDLMIESGEVLRTWRLEAPPGPGMLISATQSPDHRLFYLEYEGEVSGGRGTVTRWDHGRFEWLAQTDDLLELELSGVRSLGRAQLRREESADWTFRLMPAGVDSQVCSPE